MAIGSREDRKMRVAEATWRIIATQGITAVSVRAVAEEASLAVGSLRHLFPTQDSLLEFAAELMIQQVIDRVAAVSTQRQPDPVDQAVAVITELMPTLPHTRRESEINLALIVHAPATPRIAEIRDQAHLSLLRLFEHIVGELADDSRAMFDLQYRARRLLALADGLGMHLLHQHPQDPTEWAMEMIRHELLSIQGR